MIYPEEAPAVLIRQHEEVQGRLQRAYMRAIEFSYMRLTNQTSKEFMGHGVARRLGVITKSAQNIFSIFPPDRRQPLGRDLLEDLNINLHAFVLHVNALQDNLAWTYVHEHGLTFKRKQAVSLFGDRLRKILPLPLREYLEQEVLQKWHKEYSTEFRDALAHQIPLYVPPTQLTNAEKLRSEELNEEFLRRLRIYDFEGVEQVQEEQNSLGVACPQFLHSLRAEGTMVLHPQVICDQMTALDLFDSVTKHWGPPELSA